MARVLTLDAALAVCSAGLVEGGCVLDARSVRDDLAALPALVESLFAAHGRALHAVVVTVGPGSFTGLRAAISLAHGIGIAAGVPVIGVSVGAALAAGAPPGRPVWAAIDSKRGRVFLERDGALDSVALDRLPRPDGPIAVVGDAAVAVVARLAAAGVDVQLLRSRAPDPGGIARAASAGQNRPAQPLYVDPPDARPGPPGRPAPA